MPGQREFLVGQSPHQNSARWLPGCPTVVQTDRQIVIYLSKGNTLAV
jgi:hypothetical protein